MNPTRTLLIACNFASNEEYRVPRYTITGFSSHVKTLVFIHIWSKNFLTLLRVTKRISFSDPSQVGTIIVHSALLTKPYANATLEQHVHVFTHHTLAHMSYGMFKQVMIVKRRFGTLFIDNGEETSEHTPILTSDRYGEQNKQPSDNIHQR